MATNWYRANDDATLGGVWERQLFVYWPKWGITGLKKGFAT